MELEVEKKCHPQYDHQFIIMSDHDCVYYYCIYCGYIIG